MAGCRALKEAEVREVVRAMVRKRDKALFILGSKSGFRITELLSLTVGDVLRNGQIVSYVTVRRANMKKKKEGRTVPLHPEARRALHEWLTELGNGSGTPPPSTYLFVSRKGRNRPITRQHAHALLREAFGACELSGSLGTHSMRKTFANNVHEKLGRDLFKTQKALGHANIQSTVRYLESANEEIEAAILSL